MGMPGKSGRLIDDAVAAASAAARELGTDAAIQWAWFDSAVEPMGVVKTPLAAPRAVVGDTRYFPAFAWARDRVAAASDSVADVVVVTDLQQSGLSGGMSVGQGGGLIDAAIDPSSLQFPAVVPVRIIDVGRVAADNLAINHLAIPAARIDPSRNVVVVATLFNYATEPSEDVPLTASAVSIGNQSRTIRVRKTIDVAADQASEVVFNFGPLEPAMWHIMVSADVADDQAFDNERRTAVVVAPPTEILVLDSGDPQPSGVAESFHLVTALSPEMRREDGDRYEFGQRYDQRSVPNGDDFSSKASGSDPLDLGRFAAEVLFLNQQQPGILTPNDPPLVVVGNAAGLEPALVNRLAEYVRAGGKLLVFAGDASLGQRAINGSGGDPSDTLTAWESAQLAPGKFGRAIRGGVAAFRITRINEHGEMLRPFLDPQLGDLSRLPFEKVQTVQPRTEASDLADQHPSNVASATEVLAWFDGDQPAVTQHFLGDGRVVWFLAAADESWGQWTKSPLYLPLIQQMAADLLNQTGEGSLRFRTVGDAATNDELTRGSDPAGGSDLASGADPISGFSWADGFMRPGYQARGGLTYVVNEPAKESDPTRTTPETISKTFGFSLQEPSDSPVDAVVASIARRELWPWLAAGAFVLMLAEYFLANRTTA